MEEKMKKYIGLFLVVVLIVNLISVSVCAQENKIAETVYVEGVKFNVFLDDNMNVVVEGNSALNKACMILEPDGNAELELLNETDDKSMEEYEIEIVDLQMDNVDVEVCQEGEMVEEFTDLEDITEDEYDGQVGIVIGAGVVITIGMVLEALLAACLAVIIGGIVYIVATKFYSAVQAASKTKREKARKYYYAANIWKGKVVIVPKAITKSKAIARVKKNQSVYSFSSTLARKIITQSGCFYYPTRSRGEIDLNRRKGNVYLYHYHKGTNNGHAYHNGFHSFYGAPVIG